MVVNYNNKKYLPVLVIGGAGYIGSHIVLELCERGIPVVVFDNLSSGYKNNIDSRADFIEGDILDQEKGIINLKTTPADIDEWDSVANINIIVSLEGEFGIKFKLKDVQEAKTVQDFVELVEAYKK